MTDKQDERLLTQGELRAVLDDWGKNPEGRQYDEEVCKAQLAKADKHGNKEALHIIKGNEHTEEFTKHRLDRPDREKIANLLQSEDRRAGSYCKYDYYLRIADQILALFDEEEIRKQTEEDCLRKLPVTEKIFSLKDLEEAKKQEKERIIKYLEQATDTRDLDKRLQALKQGAEEGKD